ncbi:hypothetical protein MM817_00782 [Acidibacillus sp. S0AB]|uniref:Uncharacterized protein n=1 Tax=Sulfoacidibacillus ferrooxidans TaxID=2005001 RepID=A0A9X1V7C7_9BACL|nr:hypothetical protein [Sulfoacidibacillus ferrooxidans]
MAAPGFLCGSGYQKSRLQIDVNLLMPSIQVLTHHDPEDSCDPHFGTAMPGGFKSIVYLFPLVGTLNGRSTFVDILPHVAVTCHRWKQTRIVLGVGVHAATIRRVGTRCITSTDALLHQGATVLASPTTAVVAIVFHGQTLLANGYARRGN